MDMIFFLLIITPSISTISSYPQVSTRKMSHRRVIHGQPATLLRHPYIAALLKKRNNTSMQPICAGAIIHKSAILSAAHCLLIPEEDILVKQWRARVGSVRTWGGGKLVRFQRFHFHKFNNNTLTNDLVILETHKPIQFLKNSVEKIPIANWKHKLEAGERLVVIGWGKSNINNSKLEEGLKEVELTLITNEKCNLRYSVLFSALFPRVATPPPPYNHVVSETMMCAGSYQGAGICTGDSGDPVVHMGLLVGVVSWNAAGCNTHLPSVFTRLTPYVKWIVHTVVKPSFGRTRHDLRMHNLEPVNNNADNIDTEAPPYKQLVWKRAGEGDVEPDTQAARTDTQAARTDTQAARTDTQAAWTDTQAAQPDTQAAQTDMQAAEIYTQGAQPDMQLVWHRTYGDNVEPDTPDRPDAPDRADMPDRLDTPERLDTPDRPDAPDRADTPDRLYTPERLDTPDRPDTADMPNMPDTPYMRDLSDTQLVWQRADDGDSSDFVIER